MAKRGRPSTYSEEVARTICERMASGMSLRSACQGDGMPAPSTVCGWALDDVNGFAEQYTRACEIRTEMQMDEMVDLADSATPENVQVVKTQIDTRKWKAARERPKKWGDRQLHEHEGGVTLNVVTGVPDGQSE